MLLLRGGAGSPLRLPSCPRVDIGRLDITLLGGSCWTFSGLRDNESLGLEAGLLTSRSKQKARTCWCIGTCHSHKLFKAHMPSTNRHNSRPHDRHAGSLAPMRGVRQDTHRTLPAAARHSLRRVFAQDRPHGSARLSFLRWLKGAHARGTARLSPHPPRRSKTLTATGFRTGPMALPRLFLIFWLASPHARSMARLSLH